MRSTITMMFLIVSFSLVLIVAWDTDTHAQGTESTCPGIVTTVVDIINVNCGTLSVNTACYGNDLVQASFIDDVPESYFTQPADRTELSRVQNISTAPLDVEEQVWGVAVLNVQANVPNTLPGEVVTFILLGDSQIENRVDPTAVQPYIVPVTVTTTADANGFLDPESTSETLGDIPEGTDLLADALDETTEWLRVVFSGQPMWVERAVVSDALGLDALTVLSADSFTPMQAFYFSTGVGQPVCNDAPNMITVRSPDNIRINLNINGADVRLGSMVTLQSIGDNQAMFTVHEGHLEIVDSGVVIPVDRSIMATLGEDGTIDSWSDVQASSDDALSLGETSTMMMTALERDSAVEPITVSTDADGQVIHIVAVGETLFSIARLYEASMPEIVRVNSIDNARNIFVGQRLIIPNAGSGFVNLPIDPNTTTVDTSTESDNAVAGVDCSTFALTSPFDGLNRGQNTFYWAGAEGATSFRVRVFNVELGRNLAFETRAYTTSLTATLGISEIGSGFLFEWDVQALYNGQVACTSPRISLQRASDVTTNTFVANWACVGTGQANVVFSGAPAGDTVSGDFMDDSLPIVVPIPSIPGPSGSTTAFFASGTVSGGALTGTPSGQVAPILPAVFNVGGC